MLFVRRGGNIEELSGYFRDLHKIVKIMLDEKKIIDYNKIYINSLLHGDFETFYLIYNSGVHLRLLPEDSIFYVLKDGEQIADFEHKYQIIKYLIDNGANVNHDYLFTNSCGFGHLKIIKLFIENNVNVNINNSIALIEYLKFNKNANSEIVSLLIHSGIDLSVRNNSAIHVYTKYNSDPKIINLMNCNPLVQSKEQL